MSDDHIGVKIDGVIYVKLDDVKPMRARIKKLEAALLEMLSKCTWQKREQWCGSMGCHCQIARKALEGKDE